MSLLVAVVAVVVLLAAYSWLYWRALTTDSPTWSAIAGVAGLLCALGAIVAGPVVSALM